MPSTVDDGLSVSCHSRQSDEIDEFAFVRETTKLQITHALIMLDDRRSVFDRLGYHSEPVHFERAIPYPKLRERFESPFSETELSRVLRNLPELFVMNHKMVHGMFFAKILEERNSLTVEQESTYEKFYPRDIFLLDIARTGTSTLIEGRWFDEPDKYTSLAAALTSRFSFALPDSVIQALAEDGWLV